LICICEHHWLYIKCSNLKQFSAEFYLIRSLLLLCLSIRSLLQVCLSIEKLLLLCLSSLSLLLLCLSNCNQILILVNSHCKVQVRHDYFRIVEGTCTIALYHSSYLSLLKRCIRLWTLHQTLNSIELWLLNLV